MINIIQVDHLSIRVSYIEQASEKEKVEEEPAEVTEVPPPLVSTDPLICAKCQGGDATTRRTQFNSSLIAS